MDILKKLMVMFAIALLPMFANAQTFTSAESADLSSVLNAESDTIYVVKLWATWSKESMKDLQEYEALQKAYPDKKVKVLLVSYDLEENIKCRVIPTLYKRNIQADVVFLRDRHSKEWVESIDSEWNGTIPATIVVIPGQEEKMFFPDGLAASEAKNIIAYNLK